MPHRETIFSRTNDCFYYPELIGTSSKLPVAFEENTSMCCLGVQRCAPKTNTLHLYPDPWGLYHPWLWCYVLHIESAILGYLQESCYVIGHNRAVAAWVETSQTTVLMKCSPSCNKGSQNGVLEILSSARLQVQHANKKVLMAHPWPWICVFACVCVMLSVPLMKGLRVFHSEPNMEPLSEPVETAVNAWIMGRVRGCLDN